MSGRIEDKHLDRTAIPLHLLDLHSPNEYLLMKDFCSSIHLDHSVRLSEELRAYADVISEKTGVYVLEDGGGSLVARAWLTEAAEQQLIFSISFSLPTTLG